MDLQATILVNEAQFSSMVKVHPGIYKSSSFIPASPCRCRQHEPFHPGGLCYFNRDFGS
jgi:hypothetical protein